MDLGFQTTRKTPHHFCAHGPEDSSRRGGGWATSDVVAQQKLVHTVSCSYCTCTCSFPVTSAFAVAQIRPKTARILTDQNLHRVRTRIQDIDMGEWAVKRETDGTHLNVWSVYTSTST